MQVPQLTITVFDVEVVQRVGDAMEQWLSVVIFALCRDRRLRSAVAAAEVTGGSTVCAPTCFHSIAWSGEPHLREQALGAASEEVEHRLASCAWFWVADDGDDVVLDVEQPRAVCGSRPGGFGMKWITLHPDRRPGRGGGAGALVW